MSATTLTRQENRNIVATVGGMPIGVMERITYITEGEAAMGTISFAECVADPHGCDIEIHDEQGTFKFFNVDLSNNLYLEVPIMFVTDRYSRSE